VVKLGANSDRTRFLWEQAEHCRVLGPRICPYIYGMLHNGYVMEELDDNHWHTPTTVLSLLANQVWGRRWTSGHVWRQRLQEFLGDIEIPDWVADEESCLTHGDPTMANVMQRDQDLILIDPIPAGGKMPSVASVDRAAIIQSVCGWETIISGENRYWQLPGLCGNWTDLDIRRTLFWLMVKARRILPYARTEEVVQWCGRVDKGVQLALL
jgi:hypothetical protein